MPPKKNATAGTAIGTVLPMATSVPDTVKDKRKARHTAWTLNNWSPDELQRVRDYAQTECRYMCWSQEVGEEGTPHLQGYTAWENPRSLAKFKNQISEKKLHYEPYTNGTALQNRNYCLGMVEKKGFTPNPSFEEVGELPAQGERTDWSSARTQLQTGHSIVSVIEAQPQLLPSIRSLERYQTLSISKPTHREVQVIILIGQSGTGKTRWAYENYPDLYSKPEGQWYDAYAGEKTLLLDDYYGDIPYSQLLKVLDRYPLQVPQKGSHIYAQWTTVIITSNRHPNLWYPQGYTDALKRRTFILEEDYSHYASPPRLQAYIQKEASRKAHASSSVCSSSTQQP